METKEMRIEIPVGYEIDKENSTFECIKFKPKSLTYEDVAKELFADKYYHKDLYGNINLTKLGFTYPNNATSEKQLEKLLAINKLMNVAKYLNGDWKPNWDNPRENKYYIYVDYMDNSVYIGTRGRNTSEVVYFKSKELAQQAVDILGEDTIRLALSTDW